MPNPGKPATKSRPSARTRLLITAKALALMVLAGLPEVRAETFGQCARQRDVDAKIASCLEASQSTSYPRILRWVHRELARAYRQRGENEKAITSYSRALAAGERASIRREMEELTTLPRPM